MKQKQPSKNPFFDKKLTNILVKIRDNQFNLTMSDLNQLERISNKKCDRY